VLGNTEEFRVKSKGNRNSQEQSQSQNRDQNDDEEMPQATSNSMSSEESNESESDSEEDQEEYDQKGRYVGMVMIPWKYVLDVEEDQMTSIARYII